MVCEQVRKFRKAQKKGHLSISERPMGEEFLLIHSTYGDDWADSMLMLMHSDCEVARTHTVDGIPIILAGKAGGRIKAGMHLAGNSIEPVSRIGRSLRCRMAPST